MRTNRECVYPDLSNLFVVEDVTDQVDQLMDNVPNNMPSKQYLTKTLNRTS